MGSSRKGMRGRCQLIEDKALSPYWLMEWF